MRIIRDDFDQIVHSFGASRRVATRLSALARRGLYVSETVLEFALDDDGDALKKLLLSRGLLDAADDLDDDGLAKMAQAEDEAFFEENPLSLRRSDGVRILALEEEAGEVEGSTNDQPDTAITSFDESPTGVIARDEARRLLSDDEVSRLKLDLVTSSDAGRRLEALRKLYLSELKQREKLKLFLTALRDREAEVRAEAARALGGLGLESSLTENLARAARGATDERVVAISNLDTVLEKIEASQARLAIGLVIEFVTPSEEREVVLGALGVLAAQIPRMDDGEAMASHLHKQLIELLQVRLSQYEDAARRLYNALFVHHRALMSRLLTRTVEEIAQPGLRFFALSLITEHDLESASAPAVIQQLIQGLTTGSELDSNYQACSAALTRLGEKSVDGLLAALEDAGDAGRERIIALLGHMLRERGDSEFPVKEKTAARITGRFLQLYDEAGPEVCTALLESGFHEHPSLDDEARRHAAERFLESLHEFRFERQVELVQAALVRCGRVSIEPLRRAMLESGHDVTRLTAAKLLPEIVSRDPDVASEDLASLVAEVRSLTDAEENDFPDRGPLHVALGRIGAHPSVSEPEAEAIAVNMRERIGHSSNVYDIIEGLGYLAAGANLPRSERLEIGHLLLTVLKRGLPGMSGRIRKNEEGEDVLHFGRETTAYTDMIPRILEGLGRLIEAEKTPDVLFERITEELIKLWKEITDYRRIWAPAATMTLAQLLGRVALGDRRSSRMAGDIAELLSRKLILLPVMQVLGELLLTDGESERLNIIAKRIFTELTKRLNEEPAPEPVERRQILRTLTSIVQRARIGDSERDVAHARKVVVEALFDALRDKLFAARDMLGELSRSDNLSETMRNEIARRLKPAARRG